MHGCQGLRIIDPSVFRDPIGGSIKVAVMAVAGKGTVMVLEDVAGG
nr:GMC family oxidoreductase [Sphingomonas sp. CDS-1]